VHHCPSLLILYQHDKGLILFKD